MATFEDLVNDLQTKSGFQLMSDMPVIQGGMEDLLKRLQMIERMDDRTNARLEALEKASAPPAPIPAPKSLGSDE